MSLALIIAGYLTGSITTFLFCWWVNQRYNYKTYFSMKVLYVDAVIAALTWPVALVLMLFLSSGLTISEVYRKQRLYKPKPVCPKAERKSV